MKQKIFLGVILSFTLCLFTHNSSAWSEHPMLVHPVLKGIPSLTERAPVEVMSLKAFLIANEKGLENLLNSYEEWAMVNLAYYPPTPHHLRFVATGNPNDIVERFLQAIRMNPDVKMRLYLHLLPGEPLGERKLVDPSELTTLSNTTSMSFTNYVELIEGELISPLKVLSTANDEPDYGFDLGLYEDNSTPYGSIYGFGIQPFGDPNLEYGSQAPFHMGFYHEKRIVFLAAPFLKRTLPEYRISLFRTLSVFAVQEGYDYWGMRFMGWGMHYLGDLSMPYHAAPLPGVSALRMIWINLKAMLGFPRSRDNALQLVSNKHAVLEHFQWQILRDAYHNNDMNHPLIQALKNPIPMVDYHDSFPREVAAKEAVGRSRKVNRTLLQSMPKILVADPSFEAPGSPELLNLTTSMVQEKGPDAIDNMTQALAEIFSSYSMHISSFYANVMSEGERVN